MKEVIGEEICVLYRGNVVDQTAVWVCRSCLTHSLQSISSVSELLRFHGYGYFSGLSDMSICGTIDSGSTWPTAYRWVD